MLPSTSSINSGLRPSSSQSNHRPPSSTSARSLSRLSTRSNVRHARSRLVPLAQALVKQVTGLDEGKDADDALDFREAVDFVVKNLEATTLNKGATSVDMNVIDRQIKGHSLKARVNSQDELGEALETCYQELKKHVGRENDLDQEIQRSHLPDHLQFLIKMSAVPSQVTRTYASSYLYNRAHPPPPPEPLTWTAIVAEEPFEGEHWEGVYGLPPGFIRRSQDGDKNHYDKEKERQRLDWDSRWSTPSLSPLNSDDLELDAEQEAEGSIGSDDAVSLETPGTDINTGVKSDLPYTYEHRREFEALRARQYWRPEWKGDVNFANVRKFDLGDASTLGPTLSSILFPIERPTLPPPGYIEAFVQNERYINEEDAVREVLMALQGRENILFEWKVNAAADEVSEGIYTTTQSTPRLLHLSLGSQASIFSSLSRTATVVQRLRHFVQRVFEDAQKQHLSQQPQIGHIGKRGSTPTTRTREAFADAIDEEIRTLDKWCSAKEEAMCIAWGGGGSSETADQKLVVSLLGTEKDVRDAFERTFDVLLDVVKQVYPLDLTRRSNSAAAVSAALLDRLFERVQEHLERRERVTSEALMRVFVRTAEPVWGMIGQWLRDGMGLGVGIGTGDGRGVWELEEEFFIESSGLGLGMMGLGLQDPEFWKQGYGLREDVDFGMSEGGGAGTGRKETGQKMIPLFLEHVAEPVLSAGKSVGLLRALGVSLSSITLIDGSGPWRSFAELIGPFSASPSGAQLTVEGEQTSAGDVLFSVSIDNLSRLIYDNLLPRCNAGDALLAQVLVEECSLWGHLESIEDLFLMRRGDAMSHFADILFAKMDAQQPWGDFHFLNTAFNDVVEASTNAGAGQWVQTSLVRLFYRGGRDKDKAANRTVKDIDGLVVEYAVPFPLTYIFQPSAINVYREVFVFLLQIRRAKSALERILVRRGTRAETLTNEMKVFYAMRSRLSWFTNAFFNFLTTNVVHAQILKFHEALHEARSLDEMVKIHDDHLNKIQGRCLLKPNTSSLHRAILSTLDMALHFADLFVAFSGDTTTHDLSLPVSIKRHGSRRQRKQRRNTIGFSISLRDSQWSSSSDDDDDDDREFDNTSVPESSFSMNASVSYAEEGFQQRMEKMSSELDGLVRFLRRGVESLAGGTGEAAPAFGVLAFTLEDWDN